MPLFADATGLVALGRINSIHLLRHYDPHVIISPWVRQRELRQFADQVDRAIAGDWLREETPSATIVQQLQEMTELNRGEVETIALAGAMGGERPRLLLDEGPAFEFLVDQITRRRRRWELVCLAQVLHHLESAGHIESARVLMQDLLDNRHYSWAGPVRRRYEIWCRERNLAPLPERGRRREGAG